MQPGRNRSRGSSQPVPTASTSSSASSSSSSASSSHASSNNGKQRIVPPDSAYVSLDCEMVGVKSGLESALAQVTICDFDGLVIYNSYCASDHPIVDYRSWVSGIRPSDLIDAPDFPSVQNSVREHIRGKILVGHALHNDLEVLCLDHPPHMIRDTALYAPLQQIACTVRPSLRALAKLVLNKDVQSGEHSAMEDAKVTMAIFRHHRTAWETSLATGQMSTNPAAQGFVNSAFPMAANGYSGLPSPPFTPPFQRHQHPQQPNPIPELSAYPHPSVSPFASQFMHGPPGGPSIPSGLPGAVPSPQGPTINPALDPRFSAANLPLPPSSSAGNPASGIPAEVATAQQRTPTKQLNAAMSNGSSLPLRAPANHVPFSAPPAERGNNHLYWQHHMASAAVSAGMDMSASPLGYAYVRQRQASFGPSLPMPSASPLGRKSPSRKVTIQRPPFAAVNGQVLDAQQRAPSPSSTASSHQSDNSSADGDPFSARAAQAPSANAGKGQVFGNASNDMKNGQQANGRAKRMRVPLRDADSVVVPAAA